MQARIISIANQKGGVGKTTTALTLGAALAKLNKCVLVMDFDPHACATIHMAFYPEKLKYTSLDIFTSDPGFDLWSNIIYKQANAPFDFVPASIRLSDLEADLKDRPAKGMILQKHLKGVISRYDYVLIDCPPHVGVILINALVAADLVIIPIQTDFLALHGLKLILDTIKTLNRALARVITYRALPTMFDKRAGACQRVLALLRAKLGTRVFQTVINIDTKFRDASARGQVILGIAPKSRGSIKYMELAKEIIDFSF